jgi:serine/threonine protein kinase
VTKGNLPLRPGSRLDAYTVDGVLSVGGFSVVYLARDERGEKVVIKEYFPGKFVVRTGKSPCPSVPEEYRGVFAQGMTCFVEEARILRHLRHPNIVHVLNFFRANDTAYLVMRYESGASLDERIRMMKEQRQPVTEAFLRSVFVRMLSALREVHVQKLLHLDIKPANIYLRDDDQPVLIDFGASRRGLGLVDPALTPVHTPGFAAPEQQGLDEPLGPWTDIYSVGATLYACLAGETPQAADQRLIKDTLPLAQRRWFRRYSAQLLELIDWSMCLPSAKRPQSAFALQKVLDGGLLDLIDPSWLEEK